jgi:hypothetical protein
MTAIRMEGVAEPYIRRRAKRHLEKGRIVILAAGRVGFNAYSSNVVDVGYAGVVGADRILDGRSPYGSFPIKTQTPCGTRYADGTYSGYVQANGHCETAIERGDTYGPAMYLAYVPGTAALGWSGRWDDLPAAHFTSGLFDLLTAIGLAVFGWQFGGRKLAAAMALFWLAVPWSAYTFMSDSNDAIVAAYLAWSAALIARPVGRGALVMLAALAKFAPLILLPLWLRLDRPPPRPRGEWPYGQPAVQLSRGQRVWTAVRPGPGSGRTLLGMVLVTVVLAGILIALDGSGALADGGDDAENDIDNGGASGAAGASIDSATAETTASSMHAPLNDDAASAVAASLALRSFHATEGPLLAR